ncbi:MAG: putative Fe-S oxidoreductase [Rhodospirillales bacterium]|nr:putative Fe-S oxidoreductase [Rhodospirillales bacterium]
MRSFAATLAEHGRSLTRDGVTVLQINLGKRCNQACHHCHVEAGPKRSEMMAARTADRLIELMASAPQLRTIDITGGAPELNPNFRRLVAAARELGKHVIDRCNLTVLFEAGQEDTARFLAEHEVAIVASLPCYSEKNVDAQRGRGVFGQSIAALKLLNRLGYGSTLPLDLVYNPVGAFLPPAQAALEHEYRFRLRKDFEIEFSRLLTITNMPISRFLHALERDGQAQAYQQLLVDSFNPHAVDGVMCRSMLSVSWDGKLYDCDFNQMLELKLPGQAQTIWDVDSLAEIDRRIAVGPHCFGCTAGAGSSCGGALETRGENKSKAAA